MGRSVVAAWRALVLCGALVACSAAPAPFADVLPESTLSAGSTPSPAANALRYGLDERLKGIIDLSPLEGRAW